MKLEMYDFENDLSLKYWNFADIHNLKHATRYSHVVGIAKTIISKMRKEAGKPIVQICGPISTGGKGSIEANIAEFNKAIKYFTENGRAVFTQLPFGPFMIEYRRKYPIAGYDMRILTQFYLQLFKDGFIDELEFLPDWRSSESARFEEVNGRIYNLKINYILEDWC